MWVDVYVSGEGGGGREGASEGGGHEEKTPNSKEIRLDSSFSDDVGVRAPAFISNREKKKNQRINQIWGA